MDVVVAVDLKNMPKDKFAAYLHHRLEPEMDFF